MTRSGRFSQGEGPEEKLVFVHRLICEALNGPGTALLKGRASRSELSDSVKKLHMATTILEEMLNA